MLPTDIIVDTSTSAVKPNCINFQNMKINPRHAITFDLVVNLTYLSFFSSHFHFIGRRTKVLRNRQKTGEEKAPKVLFGCVDGAAVKKIRKILHLFISVLCCFLLSWRFRFGLFLFFGE